MSIDPKSVPSVCECSLGRCQVHPRAEPPKAVRERFCPRCRRTYRGAHACQKPDVGTGGAS